MGVRWFSGQPDRGADTRQSRSVRTAVMKIKIVVTAGMLVFGQSAVAQAVDYLRDVKPILAERCFSCHGAIRQKGGPSARHGGPDPRGGESGPVDRARQERREPADRARDRGCESAPTACRRRARGWRSAITRSASFAPGSTRERRLPPRPCPRTRAATGLMCRRCGQRFPTLAGRGWSANPIDAFLAAAHQVEGITRQSARAEGPVAATRLP